jgi:Mg2+/Co2+ transporter CorC
MAIVCQTSAAAAELRDFADLKNQKYLSKSNIQNLLSVSASAQNKEESFFLDGEKEVVGIVTLENVIERILLTDIHDEKDREAARQLR